MNPCASVAYVLPTVSVRFEAVKPERRPFQGDALSAHLLRRRDELGMFQKDAAKALGINQWTLINWEAGVQPYARYYPSIIGFLGYEPWPVPHSLHERLKAARLRRGWSKKTAAQKVRVDEASWARWERGGRMGIAEPERVLMVLEEEPHHIARELHVV